MTRAEWDRRPAAIAAGAAAGLIGGLFASWLMVKFQRDVWPPPKGDEASSTGRLVEDVAAWSHFTLSDQQAKAGGRLVHYALGAGLGLAYGAAAVVKPNVALGGGVMFGVATELIIDQAMVPTLGLANPFWKCPVEWHLRGLAAHIVFGVATDAARRLVDKVIRDASAQISNPG